MEDINIWAQLQARPQPPSSWVSVDPIHPRFLCEVLYSYVDDTGIEPVTPTMSMWCSTAEPIVRV